MRIIWHDSDEKCEHHNWDVKKRKQKRVDLFVNDENLISTACKRLKSFQNIRAPQAKPLKREHSIRIGAALI